MIRQNLKNLLLQYTPQYTEEINAKSQMLAFLEQYPDCFERSCKPGHFTASSWLLSHDLSKVLLMHHAKLDMWLQLGGHCDGDHDVKRVSLKEAEEESGLINIEFLRSEIFDIDVHQFPESKNDIAHMHYDVRFLLKAPPQAQIIKNHESKDLRWFTKDLELLPTKEKSVTRMFEKWLALDKSLISV